MSLERAASADIAPNEISISAFNPGDAVAPASTVEGPGIKVGEGTVLHPVFGIETALKIIKGETVDSGVNGVIETPVELVTK